MKRCILSLIAVAALTGQYAFAQTGSTNATTELAADNGPGVNPKQAFLNVSYKLQGTKMLVMVDENKTVPVFTEVTSSTLNDDTYKIYSADGKTLIATYTVSRRGATIAMTINKNNTTKNFDLTEYIARATSDLEKDAIKRKTPVYWLYKNGLAK